MSESKKNLYRVKLDVVPRTVAATDRPGRRFQSQRKPPRHIAICCAVERGSFHVLAPSQPLLKSRLGHVRAPDVPCHCHKFKHRGKLTTTEGEECRVCGTRKPMEKKSAATLHRRAIRQK